MLETKLQTDSPTDPLTILPDTVRVRLSQLGYSLQPAGEPARFAFVGQSTYFTACALEHPQSWAVPRFFEFRAGGDIEKLRSSLAEFDPHIILVFRPELTPPGMLHEFPAVTVGYLTEPLPRTKRRAHRDLRRRLEYLEPVDPSNFDRIVSFDPVMVTGASKYVDVWRSIPIPVADSLYVDEVKVGRVDDQPLFIGRSTKHRERLLEPVKHVRDILHIAHGVDGEALKETLAKTSISINLHNEAYPSFENRVAIHLAAGHLLITEPLSPTHGLEAGIDYIEVETPEQLHEAVRAAMREPAAFLRMRERGRTKAELFRASHVYPHLIHDLYRDVATFGPGRRERAVTT